MGISPFEQALDPGVARSTLRRVAGKMGFGKRVPVIFSDKMCTDGETIWTIDVGDKADKKIQAKSRHGFYHESGHVLFTDFKRTKSWMAGYFRQFHGTPLELMKAKKLLHTMHNVLEDVRIENRMCLKYPGLRFSMHDFIQEFVYDEINARFLSPKTPLVKKLMDLCYLDGRDLQFRAEGMTDLGIVVPPEVGQIYTRVCQDIVNRLVKVEEAEPVYKLAEELYEALKKLQEEEPDPPQPPPPPPPPPPEPAKPVEVGDVLRNKKTKTYGRVVAIPAKGQYEVEEITKEEARKILAS